MKSANFDKGSLAWIWEGVETAPEVLSELQPKWALPNRSCIVADVGHCTDQEMAVERIVASLSSGACAVHLHLVNEAGEDTDDIGLWTETVEEARRRSQGPVIVDAGIRDSATPYARLQAGLLQIVPVNVCIQPTFLHELIARVRDNGAVPEIVVFGGSDIAIADKELFRTGVMGPGATWLLDPSGATFGMPMQTPEQMARGFVLLTEWIRTVDPQAQIITCAAGRASSYLTAMSLLMGHGARPGTGETHWRFPHSDDLHDDPLPMLSDCVAIAAALGRHPLGATEYSNLLGLMP